MPKKMLFNATEPEEVRAAIVHNNKLLEFDLEARTREQNRNNIYRGYVVQVEASIQAAFVEYGTGRHGFLPFREIHPDFYTRQPKSGDRHPSIDQVIKKGQQVVVQVVREEVDHKGAALTTYCTLPGRYLVLMPRSENSGISRKIEESEERQALREIMRNIKPPEGFGYIVRTAGLGKSEADISRDLDIMVRLWQSIQKAAQRGPRSGLVFQDADIIQRMIRDYYESDVDEIWIDDQESFERAHTYFSAVMPNVENVVKHYTEDTPLFAKHRLEAQISGIYARQVPLPSGGSIVIDTTEALVAIDVNSGKTQSNKTEDTAYKTNCEAAVEIANQLRLRDLGGLIVIDFIGMRLTRHMRGVERSMRDAIKDDKARTRLGRITSIFGLLTLSRQRIRDKKELTHFMSCPACRGTGKYPNVETNALKAYRHLQRLVADEKYDRISASLPKDVALYLLNFKREQITQMEQEFDVQISIMPKDSINLDLERDISVQLRSRESRRKRKERTPIELPYERLSNESSEATQTSSEGRPERGQRDQREDRSSRDDRSNRDERRSRDNERRSRDSGNERKSRDTYEDASIALPDPNQGPETYFEDGWDRIARERPGKTPVGSPWFITQMKEDRSGPSIGRLAKEHGLVRPKRRRGNASAPAAAPAQAPAPVAEKAPPAPREEAPKAAPKEAPKAAEQAAPEERPQRRRRRRNELPEDAQPTQEAAQQAAPQAVAPGAPPEAAHFALADVESIKPAATPAEGSKGSEESEQAEAAKLPMPAEIVAIHSAKPRPQPQRPATKAISYRPAPYHPMNPPKAQKPEEEGGVWSNNELQRIRRAAEGEQRRMSRWDRVAPGENEQPGGVQELQEMARSMTPEAVKEVKVKTAQEGQKTILKRPAPPARAKEAPKAAPANGTSSKPTAKDGGKRNRWTDEEVTLLQSLCHLPLQEAKAAFEAEGYERSLNAFRNRYYSLRSQ